MCVIRCSRFTVGLAPHNAILACVIELKRFSIELYSEQRDIHVIDEEEEIAPKHLVTPKIIC